MRLSGRISRNGANGWDIVLRSPDGRYGRLPAKSEDFEPLRQGTELLLSGESEGHIANSDMAFRVTKDEAGARMMIIPIGGKTYFLRENKDQKVQAPVTFSLLLDFEFPQAAVRDQDTY